MADDGKSYDNRLARATTIGWECFNGKFNKSPISLPKLSQNADKHQIILYNFIVEYYNLRNSESKWNDKYHKLTNIIRKMNQYRQKHWYWKAII